MNSKKNITISDIAKHANVSKSTVSRVLNANTPVNEEKKQRVLAAMKELDYRPNLVAQNLARGSSMTLGIVTQQIGSPFYDIVSQGIISGLSETNYAPVFADGQWDMEKELKAVHTLVDRYVDGLIIVGGRLSETELKSLEETHPIVFVGRRVTGFEDRTVRVDNLAAAEELTEYLIHNGHREIAYIQGLESQVDAIDRLAGYRAALEKHNIEFNPELVVHGDFQSESGKQAVSQLLSKDISFTAIFAANDEMAYGARLKLYESAIQVPEAVSIVGFDNQPASAYMTPPLTTVEQPAFEMGVEAAQQLLAMINKQERTIGTFKTKLIERKSVTNLRP